MHGGWMILVKPPDEKYHGGCWGVWTVYYNLVTE